MLFLRVMGPPIAVGKKTSFRRDCDEFVFTCLNYSVLVGKKTSFRRDCDLPPF